MTAARADEEARNDVAYHRRLGGFLTDHKWTLGWLACVLVVELGQVIRR